VRESVDSSKNLSTGRLCEQCNAIAQGFGLPTASVSTLKRRCITLHSGHKSSRSYTSEAKIKFGKVDTGTSIPSINVQ